jgi:N utilization substance protein B
MKQRHLARQAALQVLTSLLLHADEEEKLISYVHKEFAERLADTVFLQELVGGVRQNQEKIDEVIVEFAPEWPVAKLDPVERSILELGIFELLYTQIPAPVVINEAVDLAKEFGDDTAGKFINGVLSSVARKHEKIS